MKPFVWLSGDAEYENLIQGLRSEISQLKHQLALANFESPRSGSFLQQLTLPANPNPQQNHKQNGRKSFTQDALGSTAGRQPLSSEYLEELRSKLIDNFQERMQLKRSLIDLQAKNLQNELEISKRLVAIC